MKYFFNLRKFWGALAAVGVLCPHGDWGTGVLHKDFWVPRIDPCWDEPYHSKTARGIPSAATRD
jgi:hypothetical protein